MQKQALARKGGGNMEQLRRTAYADRAGRRRPAVREFMKEVFPKIPHPDPIYPYQAKDINNVAHRNGRVYEIKEVIDQDKYLLARGHKGKEVRIVAKKKDIRYVYEVSRAIFQYNFVERTQK